MSPEDKELWIEERAGIIAESTDLGGNAARALAESCWKYTYGKAVQTELFAATS